MLHTLHAKEGGCKVIVADPRYTRTAAKADIYVRFRSGTDVPLLFGILHHVFKNGWEDKQYIHDRVYGMEEVKKEVLAKWTPDKVTEATGCSEAEIFNIAKTLADNRPGFIIWAMGQTQHTNANAIVRASNILMLALGNVGRSGGGCNIYRGHDNVQGATDIGPNPDTLPGYYPVAVPGSWSHWSRVWNVDLDWLKKQYASDALMAKPGMTVSRWIDGVLLKDDTIDQPTTCARSSTGACAQQPVARPGNGQGDGEARPDGRLRSVSVGLRRDVRHGAQGRRLPAAGGDAARDRGLATCSNRSLQWREKVIDPLFESRTDHMIMYQLAQKLGFADQLVGNADGKQNIKLVKGKGGDEPSMEDTLREINRGCWTIGYTGQTPERMPGAHAQHAPVRRQGRCAARAARTRRPGYDMTGDYYGLPWPCYGTAAIKHPGSPNLYDTSKHVMDGGGNFRALFGVERDGVNLLAEDGSHPKGAEITTGHPQFDHVLLKKLGWWD
jgi:formate dehydrogenase major subunit